MRVNAFVPTQAEIGDPMAAAARARAFRQQMYAQKPQPKAEPKAKIVPIKQFAPKPLLRQPRLDVLFIGDIIIVNGKETSFNPAYLPPGGTWAAEQVLLETSAGNYLDKRYAKRIIAQVAEEYGITSADILSTRRDRITVIPRHEAIWRVKKLTSLSYTSIGRIFNRDHSTCVFAYQEMEKRKVAQAIPSAEAVG